MVVALSSLDIHFLIEELNYLEGAKIEKIFQLKDEYTLLFALHVPSKGKKYMFISLPNKFSLIDFKPKFPDMPPAFCSSLRRKLTGARIQKISQVGFERIIQLDLTTKNGPSTLLFELFATGNIILHDESKKILSIAQSINRDKHFLRSGKEYFLPKTQLNPFELTEETFQEILSNSEKESLVKSLAIDFSLGGIFAEEIVFQSKLNKELKPKEVKKTEAKKLFKILNKLINSKAAPSSYNGVLSPLKLTHLKDGKPFETLTEMFKESIFKNFEQSSQKELEKEKKKSVSKLDKIVKAQSFQVEGLDKSQQENQTKGELVYNNYPDVQRILVKIKELKKTKDWKEIKEELKKEKLYISLDEHNGTLVLDLK